MWKILDINNLPENTKIYCDDCGLKNRSDDGWIYLEQKKDLMKNIMMKNMLMMYNLSNFKEEEFDINVQQHKYKCDYCIIKDKINNPTNKFSKKELIEYSEKVNLPKIGTNKKLLENLQEYFANQN